MLHTTPARQNVTEGASDSQEQKERGIFRILNRCPLIRGMLLFPAGAVLNASNTEFQKEQKVTPACFFSEINIILNILFASLLITKRQTHRDLGDGGAK